MEKSSLIDIVRQWTIKAEHDLEIVRRDMSSDEPLTDILCFHCQQAVEKYLKAFLVNHGIKPSKIHIIENIVLECEKIDSSFKALHSVTYMSEYAVEVRYPDDFNMPSMVQLEKAYKDACMVRDFVVKRLKGP